MRIVCRLAALLFAGSASLVAVTSSAEAQTTALIIQSDLGDYVGAGLNQTWTTSSATFTASSYSPTGINVAVSTSSYSTWWSVHLSALEGTPLAVGVYESAHRLNTVSAGLDVTGNGRSCSSTVGRFQVLEIVYNSDGTVTRFAADFEQHCQGMDAALIWRGPIQLHDQQRDAVRRGSQSLAGDYPAIQWNGHGYEHRVRQRRN